MSDTITVARAIEFNARVNYLLQQKGSKFRSAVSSGTHTGAKQAQVVDQVGLVEMLPKTGRHQDLPTVSVPLARRWVTPTPFAMRDFIDRTDQLRMLWDPSSRFAETFAMAAGIVIDAFVVRTLMIPALLAACGEASWWPARRTEPGGRRRPRPPAADEAV